MKKLWTENCNCPICGQTKLKDEFDICEVCFWENDAYQYENPNNGGGANILSQNDYKIWWKTLETEMPKLIEKYKIKSTSLALWKYDEMSVPRKNIKSFIQDMTNLGIDLRASFYNVCKKYKLDKMTFVGFPLTNSNKEIEEIIFTENPIKVCEKYKLKQIKEILSTSDDVLKTWESLTPNISVMPNPTKKPRKI